MKKHFKFYENNYYPVMFFNDFWTIKDHLIILNDTLKEISLNIEFSTLSFMKFQLYTGNNILFDKTKKKVLKCHLKV
jgi:hypothetical protein